jgi:prophage DNA circulation protein
MKLYELTNDFQRLFDSLEDMTENAELTAEEKSEAEKVWFDTLECVEAEFTDKAENVAAYVKVLGSEAKMLEAEEKALKARREQKIKQAESLKAYLMNSMQRVNLNKIEGVMAKISITKGRESTEITDPKAFVEWAKVNDDSLLKYKDPDISKTAVKAAIEAGREIPYAAVVRRPGLTIR